MDVVDLQGSCRVKRPRHFTFLVLLDPDRQLSKDFAVGFPPESFRFDRQGITCRALHQHAHGGQLLAMFKAMGLE